MRDTARSLVSRRILLTTTDGMRLLNPEKDALKEVLQILYPEWGCLRSAKRLDALSRGFEVERRIDEHVAISSYCSCR
jgi:hypothetical protein